MSFNPKVHAAGSQPYRKARRVFDPRAGVKHSAITGKHGPVGVSPVDAANRVNTPSGWRIPYFAGDTFEVYYELICARNATGFLKHSTKDRVIRVLAGQLFVTSDGKIDSVLTNQVCSFPHGSEYEYASSGDSDVEILVIQGKDYEVDVEHVTVTSAINSQPAYPAAATKSVLPRVATDRAAAEASRLSEERAVRERNRNSRTPVPKRPPLAGQQVVGVNPRPVGAGGFGGE